MTSGDLRCQTNLNDKLVKYKLWVVMKASILYSVHSLQVGRGGTDACILAL